ncbi:LacI family DNA-binding transcriptional regulator [Hydrogenophaga sp. BPS33]|uniref:LacI family DNA-binding transcriptional regulator n=1 Tax=Hydrogenophaga sp. BPS33 TaxID=2651974 RepID=UPI001320106C|nr:LacI family DNA-binding transcriptional regulator [Hydrogenophaga sp. BPS33]QHE88594.1 substrate-binding domain-containing protein [Hydrogenophaga sp. BPS33]
MRTSATAQEVARLARVSQSAVSRTFTPGASVSDATRERVVAAAKTLGYRPNALARSLITRRSHIVALVMGYLQNQFYPLVIQQLSQLLQREGYHVLMFISDENETDGALAEILQYQVDAIVIASAMLSQDLAQQCVDSGVPVVLFNRLPDVDTTRPHTISVSSDNHEGGRLVAQHLVERGHRRIAFLAGLENSSTNVERERGFVEGLRDAGHSVWKRAVGHYSFERAQAATLELFEGTERPDALFAANDHMAIAAMDVLRHQLGLRVPQDVSVVGFDDVPQAAWGSYQLTTVVQDVPAMVEATVTLLKERMDNTAPARSIVIGCRLMERGSVRAAPSASSARASVRRKANVSPATRS